MCEERDMDVMVLSVEEARVSYAVHMQGLDAVEAKLGVMLGFAAAMVALAAASDEMNQVLLIPVVAAGIVAAAAAAWGLWPVDVPVTPSNAVSVLLDGRTRDEALVDTLDGYKDALEMLSTRLKAKTVCLRLSVGGLAVATVLVGAEAMSR